MDGTTKVVVRIIDKVWRTAAWRLCGCDIKWGCAGDHGRGAVSCDYRVRVVTSTVIKEVFEMVSASTFVESISLLPNNDENKQEEPGCTQLILSSGRKT